MKPRTLKQHRKSDNKYQFHFPGSQTITITRRLLPSGAVRIRVTNTGTISDRQHWTDHRDFTSLHDADAAYSKQATQWCTKWEQHNAITTK